MNKFNTWLSWVLLGTKPTAPKAPEVVTVAQIDTLIENCYRVRCWNGAFVAYRFDGWRREGFATEQAAWAACWKEFT